LSQLASAVENKNGINIGYTLAQHHLKEGSFEHYVLYEFKGVTLVKKRLHFTHTGKQKSSNRRRKTRAQFDYALLV
jgi:hypothetical protein